MFEYKGYTGVIEYDPTIDRLSGHVVDLRDQLYFEGRSIDEVHSSFRSVVDDYLEFCAKRGEDPDRPYSGEVRLRMTPALHRQVVTAASTGGVSMNEWIIDKLSSATKEPLQPD